MLQRITCDCHPHLHTFELFAQLRKKQGEYYKIIYFMVYLFKNEKKSEKRKLNV